MIGSLLMLACVAGNCNFVEVPAVPGRASEVVQTWKDAHPGVGFVILAEYRGNTNQDSDNGGGGPFGGGSWSVGPHGAGSGDHSLSGSGNGGTTTGPGGLRGGGV